MEDFRLNIFEAVFQEQSFTKAARSLGITQSAVSQCIAELEKTLSVQLFHRSRGPVTLTEAGKVFAGYAFSILDLYAEVTDTFSSVKGTEERSFLADISPDAASMLFPDLISPFVIKGYKFSLGSESVDFSVVSVLQNGTVQSYGGECIGVSPLCIVVHPSIPAAYAGAVSLSSMPSLKLAVWTPAMRLLRNLGSRVVFNSDMTDSIISLVSQSDSIAGVVPLHSVYKKLTERTLVRLPVMTSLGNAAVYLKASDKFSSLELYSAIRRRLISLLEFDLFSY